MRFWKKLKRFENLTPKKCRFKGRLTPLYKPSFTPLNKIRVLLLLLTGLITGKRDTNQFGVKTGVCLAQACQSG